MSPDEQRAHGSEHPNMVTREKYLGNIDRYHRPRCSDMSGVIARLARHQYAAAPAV
jgi:hypothetical protein